MGDYRQTIIIIIIVIRLFQNVLWFTLYMLSINSFPGSESNMKVTHHFCSCEDNGQAEG